MTTFTPARAIAVFLILAVGYFLSSLLRGVTATLAPVLTREFGLSAGQLGLLAGTYFLGFAAMQLPLGRWLDRYGPRSVLLAFLALAVPGCIAFSMANDFWSLLFARLLGGIGVCACLMAPLTGYRAWYDQQSQLRANSWMLMAGSTGLLASTTPISWILPVYGWRPIFLALAALFAVVMVCIYWKLPRWESADPDRVPVSMLHSYAPIMKNPFFLRMAPLALVNFGTLVAVQTLWAGPWMTRVAGYSAEEAANGLFGVNLAMLLAFCAWGVVLPGLQNRGWSVHRMIMLGVPLSVLALAMVALAGPAAGWGALAAYCVLGSILTLSQPAVGLSVGQHEAGRALSAFNLVIFVGAFCWQWGIGLVVDSLIGSGWSTVSAHRAAFGLAAACSAASYVWYAFPVAVPLAQPVRND